LCQDTTLQLAEELLHGHKKCQGTTLVVPKNGTTREGL
jgi:hypothetical protein